MRESWLPVTAGTYNIYVGAGGSGDTGAGATAGGDSWFANLMAAYAGGAGDSASGAAVTTFALGGGDTIGPTGDIIAGGVGGSFGGAGGYSALNGFPCVGVSRGGYKGGSGNANGGGGGGSWKPGANGGAGGSNGSDGTDGSGGGGGGSNGDGGDGGDGFVIVFWWEAT